MPSFASWYAQNGTPINVLQELGAWKSAEVVQRYAYFGMEHLRHHADRFGEQAQLLSLPPSCDSATLDNFATLEDRAIR